MITLGWRDPAADWLDLSGEDGVRISFSGPCLWSRGGMMFAGCFVLRMGVGLEGGTVPVYVAECGTHLFFLGHH
jgi:hypothetical protein